MLVGTEIMSRRDTRTVGKEVRLVGETMREMGILVAVFAPLDAMVERASLPSWVLALLISSALLFIALGIKLEIDERE